MSISILGLQLPTDPRWVNLAEMRLEDILTDHAYCELKAATACISLIQVYPNKTYMVEQLTPVVAEEWAHFRMVLKELEKRNLALGFQRKDEYANQLLKYQMKGGSIEDRFVDKLLMSALIEARSCERFRLLSEHIAATELRTFYRNLMVAEAGHYKLFLKIAKKYLDKEEVKKRWKIWLANEKEVMLNLEIRGDRMH
jgi:tRNA-(ms[2]io[6]A)-hydroxylase